MNSELEKSASPERPPGRPFRQPIIIPRRDGTFEIHGLALPIDWGKGVNSFTGNPDFFNEKSFPAILNSYYFPKEIEGKVIIDKKINLPSFISINTTPVSYLILSKEPESENSGCYTSNAASLEAAFVLIQAAAIFLDNAREELGDRENMISFVARKGRQFEPINLRLSTKALPFSDEKQALFRFEAKNIAASFGQEILDPEFEEGFLKWIQIKGADRAEYGLGKNFGRFEYFSHNVDTPQQAATLQTIVSLFINLLQESQSPSNPSFSAPS